MSRCCSNFVAFYFLCVMATPLLAAGMAEQFGEPSNGLAVLLKPLPKDDLAPFAFEVTARNTDPNSLVMAGAKEAQNWAFEFEPLGPAGPSGPAMEGCLVHRTYSAPGPVDMRLQPRQTDAVVIRYDMGFYSFDNRRVPLSDLPAGKYRVRAVYPAFKDLQINGKENPFQGRAVSNSVEIEMKAPEDRTPRRNGFGLPSNNLAARITPTLGSKGEVNFEINLIREGPNSPPAVLRDFALTQWKFKFFQSNGDIIVVHAKKSGEAQDMHVAPQEAVTVRVKCDENWIFERNAFEVPATRLDPGIYRVVAQYTIIGSRDLNNRQNDNTWTGTLTSNVATINIPLSK